MPFLWCWCDKGHRWQLGLPWWSFDIGGGQCPECKGKIKSVQFDVEIADGVFSNEHAPGRRQALAAGKEPIDG